MAKTAKYILPVAFNLIASILLVCSLIYLCGLPDDVGLGGVAIAVTFLIFYAFYCFVYGILSCCITKSVIFPNLILLAFLSITMLVIYLLETYYYGRHFGLFDNIGTALFGFFLSFIPSLIIKLIMLAVNHFKSSTGEKTDEISEQQNNTVR